MTLFKLFFSLYHIMPIYCQAFPASENNIREFVYCQDIKHPEIVLNQFQLETGNYKCKNCSLQYNNLGGFLTKKGYMKFDHWMQFIIYYRGWQDRFYTGKYKNYYIFLDRIGYATSENYISTLKSMD